MARGKSTSTCKNCDLIYEELDSFQRLSREEDSVAAELSSRVQETQGFPSWHCVFDGSEHESVEDNLTYMAKNFGFFIPYVEQLRDVEALLTYLGQKVGIAYSCIACDTAFIDVTTVHQHMKDSDHCRMMSDNDDFVDEYGDFYVFDEDDGNRGDAAESNCDVYGSNHVEQTNCEHKEQKEEEHSEKTGNLLSSKLKMSPTPSIRKFLRRGRDTAVQGKPSAQVAQKASAAVRSQATSTMARRAALLMVGGPAVAAVSGAPLAIAGGKACLEMTGKAIDAASESRNSSMSDHFVADNTNYAKSGVPDQVMKEYRSLGWSEPRRLRQATGNQKSEEIASASLQMMVGGKSLYVRKARFKHSMCMYNQGRSFEHV